MITFLSHPFSKCQMTKRCLKWFPKGPLMSLISCLINLSLSDVSLQKTICYMIKPSIISWTMHSNYQGVAWIRSVWSPPWNIQEKWKCGSINTVLKEANTCNRSETYLFLVQSVHFHLHLYVQALSKISLQLERYISWINMCGIYSYVFLTL